MKILYINNSRIPTEKAHGIQIMKMCESFSDAGVDLELVLPFRKNIDYKKITPFEFYKVKQRFKIKKIFSSDPYWLMKFPQGIYIKFQALFFIISLFIYLLFKPNKKDYIFYTRDEYLLPILQLFSKKVVWEAHALPSHQNKYLKYWRKCLKIIVLTYVIKNKLIALGIQENIILVSPSAVDLEIFDIKLNKNQARQKLNLPQNKILLGYTGSFKTKNIEKGIQDILQAMKILLQDRTDILFVAVGGSGIDINYYKSQARKIDVMENIFLLPQVSQEKLAIYQKAFDILLMPFPKNEHYSYYMSPLKMFEYMCAQRPIIASDLQSIREVLDEDSCIFCNPSDPEDLAKKIKLILQNNSLSDRIVLNSYNNSKKYSWKRRAQQILEDIII